MLGKTEAPKPLEIRSVEERFLMLERDPTGVGLIGVAMIRLNYELGPNRCPFLDIRNGGKEYPTAYFCDNSGRELGDNREALLKERIRNTGWAYNVLPTIEEDCPHKRGKTGTCQLQEGQIYEVFDRRLVEVESLKKAS